MVESPELLLRDLGVAAANSQPTAHHLSRSAGQEAILQQLRAGPRPPDVVQRECGLPRDEVLRALFVLEAAGAVGRLPGDLLVVRTR